MTAGKYTDCLVGEDNPWPLHLTVFASGCPSFASFLIHSCSLLLPRNHFANRPFPPFSLPSSCTCLWSAPNLPSQACSSCATTQGLSFCCLFPLPTAPSHPHPGVLSQTWLLQFHFPFLLCPGETEIFLCPLQLPPGTGAGRVQFPDGY